MAGEGDSGDIQGAAEGQPAAAPQEHAHEGTGRPDPASSRRRRRKRRRARRVAAAEPGERAAAAAAAAADLGLEKAPEPAGEVDEGGEAPAPGAEPAEADGLPDADALGLLAAGTAPILRLAMKGLALALRRRFPGGAGALYARAGEHADRLVATIGLRLALRLGGAVAPLAVAAEFVEPFADDRWAGGAK